MERGTVVLLHGLGRGRLSMIVPQLRLRRAGYRPVNIGYPSRSAPIESLAEQVSQELDRRLPGADGPVHFLTHSMGGIVLRSLLESAPPRIRPGRIVMLAPPNQGSEVARTLRERWVFRKATGPAGQQLAAGDDCVTQTLGAAAWTVGVIAGNRSSSPLARLLSEESDGTVLVNETRLEGMDDFLIVPRGHTFIMNSRLVIDQAIRFFEHGEFAKKA